MDFLIKTVLGAIAVTIVLALALVMVLPLMALQAYVLCDLWGLFMTPWLQIAVPSVWSMAGILLIVRVMAKGTASSSKDEKDEDKDSWKRTLKGILSSAIGTLLIWGVGHLLFWLSTT